MTSQEPKEKKSQQRKEKKFQWSDKEMKRLLVLCREYHKKNGYTTHFNWNEIAEKFSGQGGRKVTGKEAKNKFDYMMPIWRAWSDLHFKETRAGWEQATQTIGASDELWDIKLAESDKYRRFRNKPPDPELSELWDAVYGSICATGQYTMSANMEKAPSQPSQPLLTNGENNDSQFYVRSQEETAYEQFGEQVDPTDAQQTPTEQGQTPATSAAQKRSFSTRASRLGQKRKKTRDSAATVYDNQMDTIVSTNNKVVNLLEGELGCTGSTTKAVEYQLHKAIATVDRMVSNGDLEVGKPYWCYALDEMMNEAVHDLFITFKTDDQRLAWLKYKVNK